MSRIVVTGIGIVSAAGRGLEATSVALRESHSGLSTLSRFDSPRCGHVPVAEASTEGSPRTLALAAWALEDALAVAAIQPDERTGLALGTCVAGMPESEAQVGLDDPDESVWAQHECGFVSHELAERFELGGPVTTLSTACSSAAQAIATAYDLLLAGHADVMVAGGADALCRLTLNGFVSLLNVSQDGCRPFDRNRDGMSLGEGAAFLVLERSADTPRAPLATLLGHGNTCDAHHATAPHPDGLGAEAAMQRALTMAGVAPADVDYINAHGTGTVENDRAEGRALQRMFGDSVVASSTKRTFGHTLGAAGAIEAVASILAIRESFVPGTPGCDDPDPECAITPVAETREQAVRIALSNSFGFGGNNSALCFAEASA